MSSTLDKNKQIKSEVPTRKDGTVGIRSTLNNMGIANSQIGYNEANKTVTLNGREFIKPSYIDEEAGVSYASPSDIQRSLVSFYSGSANPIVKVSDAYTKYAGQYGLSSDALGYTNGTVTIGGTPVNTLYVDDDGKAWAFQNDVENSVDDYINTLNVSTPNDILSEYSDKYLTPIYNLSQSITSRDEFSYDPDGDPVYQAYRQKYLTEGNRAAEDTLAVYSGLTGGYANSAAVTAAALAEQYYMSQLTNVIPELAQQAYERYSDKYSTDIDLLESMIELYNSAYSNAASANSLMTEGINSSLASNTARDNAAYERYWNSLFNNQDYTWTDMFNNQDYDWTEMLNNQTATSNYLDIENSRNENLMQQIYMGYYNQILSNQIQEQNLNNRLTQEKINQLILQNMIGY